MLQRVQQREGEPGSIPRHTANFRGPLTGNLPQGIGLRLCASVFIIGCLQRKQKEMAANRSRKWHHHRNRDLPPEMPATVGPGGRLVGVQRISAVA